MPNTTFNNGDSGSTARTVIANKLDHTGGVLTLVDIDPPAITHSVAAALDLSGVAANRVRVSVEAAITSLTPPSADPATGNFRSIQIDLIQDGTGHAVSGLADHADVTLASGTVAPTVSAAANAETSFTIEGNSAGAWTLFGDPVIEAAQLPAASTTAVGGVELATTAEIDAGTDTGRAMPVDQFQASRHALKCVSWRVLAPTTDQTVATSVGGDFVVPFDATIVQDDASPHLFGAHMDTAGVTGNATVDIHLNGTTIMTTNKITIETGEKSSATAATQPDLTTTSVSAGDILTVDVDAIQSGTAGKGLTVRLALRQTGL